MTGPGLTGPLYYWNYSCYYVLTISSEIQILYFLPKSLMVVEGKRKEWTLALNHQQERRLSAWARIHCILA